MGIQTTQLNNNSSTTAVSSQTQVTNTTQPASNQTAEKLQNQKPFAEEIANMSNNSEKLNDNKNQKQILSEVNVKKSVDILENEASNKVFINSKIAKNVSKPAKFSSKNIDNKINDEKFSNSTKDIQTKDRNINRNHTNHKIAEKNLEDEIMLMNDKTLVHGKKSLNNKKLIKDNKLSDDDKLSNDNKMHLPVNDKVLVNEIIDYKEKDYIIDFDNKKEIPQNRIGKVVDVTPVAKEIKQPEEEMQVFKAEFFKEIDLLDNTLNDKSLEIVKFIDNHLQTESNSKAISTLSVQKNNDSSDEKTIKMTESDAKFFTNLAENNQQNVMVEQKTDFQQVYLKDVETAKSAEVSKTLLNALKESQETNKSFRVDFDKDMAVVLRVNKNGQISAEFIPGDAVVEQYLKSNIPLLKQRFNDEGLEYENLSYRQQKENPENERNKRNTREENNKENAYE
ncbi:flagellar hook-length control protein FliK [bacterium]|nr:flagellar hook-length control protein FliK [bacterium]